MRIRSIKPEFFRHDDLFELERSTQLPLRVAFIGLWCAADREGRFAWKPRRLGSEILPYDLIDFTCVLEALAKGAFVLKYTVGGNEYGVIPGFRKHQRINPKETKSEIPAPVSYAPAGESDACLTREPSVSHASLTDGSRVDENQATRETLERGEGKGKEGKGKEEEGKESGACQEMHASETTPPPPPPTSESLEAWKSRLQAMRPGVSIETELGKARKKRNMLSIPRNWFEAHWWPNVDDPEDVVTPGKPAAKPELEVLPEPAPGWREIILRDFSHGPEGLGPWDSLLREAQDAYLKHLKKLGQNS